MLEGTLTLNVTIHHTSASPVPDSETPLTGLVFFRMDYSPHQLLPGHPGGACKSKVKCKWLLQVLLSFLCLQHVTGNLEAICNVGEERDPQAPECLNDCRGRRFFLGIDQLCKMCIQCQPGYKHDKECGNGVNGDAVCVECPEDHYSYNLYDCVACRMCENTLITRECTVSTDRQCGECLPGFYKDPKNPDLCNQRCEWLSNPDTIPACKAWLDSQQVTSLSADISMTSPFPGIIDEERIGREVTIIIIIIVLVVVIIGGSVIPVYLFCKHCKYTRSKPTDVLLAAPGDIERAFPENGVDGDDAGINIGTMADGILDTGNALPLSTVPQENGRPTGIDVIEQVRASPIMQRALEVAHAVPLSTGLQQDNNHGDVTERVGAPPVMQEALDVVVDKTLPMENSLEGEGRDNENSIVPDVSVQRSDSGKKIVHDILENKSSADKYYPSPNSHGGKFENNPLEISRDTQAPDSSNMAQTLRSTESTGISPRDIEHMPKVLDSEGAQERKDVAGNDEQDGEEVTGQEEPDESERLLPDAPRGSRDSPVISQVEDEIMPTGQDSMGGKRCEGAEARDEDGEEDGRKEGLDEHHGLLQNGGGATGGNDEEWKGSAEEESSKHKKKKDGPGTINKLQLPSCPCGNKPACITVNIESVHNLVLNDQINHHHD